MGWGEFRRCVLTLRVKSLTSSVGVFRKVGATLGETNRVFKDSERGGDRGGAIRPISTFEGLGTKAQMETHLP